MRSTQQVFKDLLACKLCVSAQIITAEIILRMFTTACGSAKLLQ